MMSASSLHILNSIEAVWLVSRADSLNSARLEQIQATCRAVKPSISADRIGILPFEALSPWQKGLRELRRGSWRKHETCACILPVDDDNLEKMRRTFSDLPKASTEQLSNHALKRLLLLSTGHPDTLSTLGLGGLVIPERAKRAETGRILLPVVEPEGSERFFLATLAYARQYGRTLTILLKSELVIDMRQFDVAAFGSPGTVLREQQRMAILTEWLRAAQHAQVPVRVHTDRSGLPFHTSVLDQSASDRYDLILLERDRSDNLLWGRAFRKIIKASSVPVWIADATRLHTQSCADRLSTKKDSAA